MISNIGSSAIDLISECVTDNCDDKESVDAVGDDMAVIDGVMVSARERAAKHPLKWGWDFHTSVKVEFLPGLTSEVSLRHSQLLCS